jgi:hypothetical protein
VITTGIPLPDSLQGPHAAITDIGTGRILRRPVLTGLINEYTRAA